MECGFYGLFNGLFRKLLVNTENPHIIKSFKITTNFTNTALYRINKLLNHYDSRKYRNKRAEFPTILYATLWTRYLMSIKLEQ